MSLQLICQLLILIQVFAAFFVTVHRDFNGRKKLEPTGFSGFVGTCVAIAIVFAVHVGSGSFSQLLQLLQR